MNTTSTTTSITTTPSRLSDSTPFQMFPSGTRIVGPVVVLQKPEPGMLSNKAMVVLSNKVLFPDGSQVVVGAQTRLLWQGPDGIAFDVAPETTWKVAASSTKAGVILNAPAPRGLIPRGVLH